MIRLANKSQVPVITFSATSPLLTSTKTPYFVRATLNDLSQESCHTWLTLYKISVISLEASNDQITNQLYKLMTMQTRVFVAHMPPNLGFRVIQKARDIGMMGEGYVWIFTDGMTNWISSTEHEVFEAALKRLPYSVIHRYVTFDTPNHSYDTLVEQVHNGMFDAAVGDITIRENRFLSVDFTLPYTESGVFMLVPMKDNENNTWFFLQPWSLDLWVTTACFFIFIGFIVWILEHRVNTDFRGPPHHQIGTSFWFSFSTINFAHREKVVSNLARFVVIVWCFVVLVLTQSYTANLTSFLTVQRLKPEVTTVNELIKNEEIVGYQNGSFVLKFLIKKGFQVSKLKAYNSAEECHTLLITGTSKGGIAAAFDEVAYLKVIISQYCNKYAIVEPSFKSSGFGFVFPKNSPLTDDVSRAILEVIENDEMQQIENKWFSKKSNCSDPTLIPSHNRLSDSEISFWRKLTILVRSFDEKDIKSHMFKDSAVHNVSLPSTQCTPRSSTVQNIPWPQNPSENMEFELRRVSLVPSEGFFTPQLEQDEDEEANTLREILEELGKAKRMKWYGRIESRGRVLSHEALTGREASSLGVEIEP
ncbi:BnaC04g40290D [Brassica napus]|uniref:BnaC04g40290D protein n=1 Tax=Brassica napus TaxID=3708 RepID=A0A078IGW1_BRANA|nr:BnaC04g40290D [Brassica napus]